MARYEHADGRFWEIALDDRTVATTTGRIGAAGRATVKEWATATRAQRERDKLVAQKLEQGWVLVGGAPTPSVWKAEWTDRVRAARAAIELPPRPAEPLAAAHARLLKQLVPVARDAIQHGLRPGPFHDATRRVLWTWLGLQPAAPEAPLDALGSTLAAAAFGGSPSGRAAVLADLVALWVARGGLPYALEVLALTLGDTRIDVEHHNGKLRGLTPVADPERRPIDRASPRVDALLRAHLAADPAARPAALAAASRLRDQGDAVVRATMSAVLLEPAWIDADLAERAATGRGLVLDVHLLHAPRVAQVVDTLRRLSREELAALDTPRVGAGWGTPPPAWPLLLLEADPVAAVPVLAALASTAAARARAEEDLGRFWLLQVALDALAPCRAAPEGVAAAVDVLAALADDTIAKDLDPRPLAREILLARPADASPLVAALRAKWARTLLPQLERLAAPVAADTGADVELPAALTGKPIDKPPGFWAPAAFAPLELASGGAAPLAAADVVGRKLKKGEDLAAVKAALTPASAAAFAWDLFQAWLHGGADSKEKWAFVALGALGDDECARRLVPLIRAWPGESAHARAVVGLEVLAAIGTDPALMGLHGIAQKVKFKGLQDRARDKMDEIAARRGLTAEQLADRLVPDLDLDDDGSRTLDFGPRTFRVGFDEALAPFVTDASGKRLSELPKPGAKDDPTLAAAAVEAWKATKKDARVLAAQQITRLELAMGAQRRWVALDFEAFLVRHPLLVHLVRRLVWGVYDADDRLLATFRVAEDRSYADPDDAPYALPDGARVGVAHRLELPDAAVATWSRVLADYAIAQPFPQLARDVYRLDDDELAAPTLTRFMGSRVETRALLGLQSRGWRRGTPQDAGVIHCFQRPIRPGLSAWLRFGSGIGAGSMDYTDREQVLEELDFADEEPVYVRRGPVALPGDVPAVMVSEVLRDVIALGGRDGEGA